MTNQERRKEDDGSTWRVDMEREIGKINVDIAEIRRDGVATINKLDTIADLVRAQGEKQNTQPNLVALMLAGLALIGGVGGYVQLQVVPLEKREALVEKRQYEQQYELGKLSTLREE